MIAYKGEASARKLHPNLVAAPRVQTDGNQRTLTLPQAAKFQPRGFYAGALFFYHKDLVFPAVLK